MAVRLRRFELVLSSSLAADEAWSRILDLRAHDRLVPFTHITRGMVPAAELRPGHEFVACTMVGRVGFRGRRLGFDDVMTFEDVERPDGERPGRARIVKSGKLVRGRIEVTVSPGRAGGAGRAERTTAGSTVRWVQDFGLARFPAVVGLAAFAIARIGYPATLRRLLRG
ncbi:hypothetical protein [Sinomonas susongensis]|uniref:hypothetical protein n=1 Tax=Sinomonas susongensis TaxID=1324851 RepID=UPI0011080730|nr:hypothetical protein [Sinomonas susongensis]